MKKSFGFFLICDIYIVTDGGIHYSFLKKS